MNLALYQLAQAAEGLTPHRWRSIVTAALIAIIFHLIFFIRWQNDALTEGAEDIGKDGIVVGIQRITQVAAPPKPSTPAPATVQPIEQTTIEAPAIQPPARSVSEPSITIPKEVPKEVPKELTQETPPEEPAKEPLQEEIEEPVAQEKPEPETRVTTPDAAATADVDSNLQPAPEMVEGGGDPAADIQYVRRLTAWLERNKRYPTKSRRRREEGTVLLNFTIDREGRLIGYELIQTAPYPALNASVEQMIKRASPLPTPPSTMQAGAPTISFTVPINFSLNRR